VRPEWKGVAKILQYFQIIPRKPSLFDHFRGMFNRNGKIQISEFRGNNTNLFALLAGLAGFPFDKSRAVNRSTKRTKAASPAGRPVRLIFRIVSFESGRNVRFDLIGVGDAVGATEHVHHGHDLADGLAVQPEPLHGGAVRMDSVLAVVGDRDRQGDDLLGAQVELGELHVDREPSPKNTLKRIGFVS
jgi:hypothetical protein